MTIGINLISQRRRSSSKQLRIKFALCSREAAFVATVLAIKYFVASTVKRIALIKVVPRTDYCSCSAGRTPQWTLSMRSWPSITIYRLLIFHHIIESYIIST